MAKQSKSAVAVSVIKANPSKEYKDLSVLVAEALGITEYLARGYVQRAVASGAVEVQKTWGTGKRSGLNAKRTKQVPAEKLLKEIGLKSAPVSQDIEEIKAIKAKNLKTLREVSAKRSGIRVVDTEASAEVVTKETDWDAATAVSRDEIKGYIHSEFHEKLGLR